MITQTICLVRGLLSESPWFKGFNFGFRPCLWKRHETRVREQNQDETLKVLHPSNKRLDIIGTITVNGQVMFHDAAICCWWEFETMAGTIFSPIWFLGVTHFEAILCHTRVIGWWLADLAFTGDGKHLVSLSSMPDSTVLSSAIVSGVFLDASLKTHNLGVSKSTTGKPIWPNQQPVKWQELCVPGSFILRCQSSPIQDFDMVILRWGDFLALGCGEADVFPWFADPSYFGHGDFHNLKKGARKISKTFFFMGLFFVWLERRCFSFDVIKTNGISFWHEWKNLIPSQVSRVHVNPSNVAQISVGGCCSQLCMFLIGRILNHFHTECTVLRHPWSINEKDDFFHQQ